MIRNRCFCGRRPVKLTAYPAARGLSTAAGSKSTRFARFAAMAIAVGVLFGTSVSGVANAAPRGAAPVEPSDYGFPQISRINQEIRQQWQEYEITPSPQAADGEWCRRVYLDIIGRIPSVEELDAFLTSQDPDRKAKLVSSLLYDDKYIEEYARNWTTIWTNVLIGRNGGTEDDTLISRVGMQKFLRDSFARNKPYNDMVYELVTAEGTTSPGSERFNGATNFLVQKVNEEKGSLATAETAKVFLGLQVQCTQCHNHPFNEWKQQKFWEFNAFFRQTRALRTFVPGTQDVASAELVNEDFPGEGNTPDDAEIYYELRNGLTKVAYPVFVDDTPVGTSGYLSDVNRRTELGKLMMQSPYLDQMIVNRMWGHFFGYGFTKPVDDMGPHNPPTHPALLEYLGQEIRTNSYNLKELIRWITLSEPYSLSSKALPGNKIDDPSLGERPKFSHFYLRQMQAEDLYESLLVATEAHKTGASYEDQEKTKSEWLRQFVIAFGTDEGGEATTFNGTIPQALMMFNGDLIKKATALDSGSFLSRVANSKMSPKQKIDYLFKAGLSRSPTSREVDIANKLLMARTADSKGNVAAATTAALQDIWWAVLNSNEFIMNH
ncbi:MAG: DUF1549 domain-containing protein [Planctomycetales bacterium]|nr:DUF1549 domain-containing protein [Planctomycetales bacterium]